MQSFHRSRGRILFEVFCALAIAESCVGAWRQTGAWALLPAAVVATLYGLVRAFDMRGPSPAAAAEPQPTVSKPRPEIAVPAIQETVVPPAPAELQSVAEPAAAQTTRPRKAKAAQKGGRRRASTREKVTEIPVPADATASERVPAEELRLTEVAPPAEQEKTTELAPPEEPKVEPTLSEEAPVAMPPPPSNVSPIPLTPLFEPEPFLRQQRVFGRKA